MRILLVEDNPADVEFTRQALKEAGVRHDLDVAEDGDEALSFLRRLGRHSNAKLPDLVLLDLNLPGTDGRQVLKAIKYDDHLRKIPVVVLTSSASEQEIDRCYELHANAYIVKPLIFDCLVETVGEIGRFWGGVARLPTAEVRDVRIVHLPDSGEELVALSAFVGILVPQSPPERAG